LKFQAIAGKTAKNIRRILFCRTLHIAASSTLSDAVAKFATHRLLIPTDDIQVRLIHSNLMSFDEFSVRFNDHSEVAYFWATLYRVLGLLVLYT